MGDERDGALRRHKQADKPSERLLIKRPGCSLASREGAVIVEHAIREVEVGPLPGNRNKQSFDSTEG